ncbi:efflux RND transporter periplasmic adaptor subunit [Chachezhania antarctica]|uniref:efflux RND transporter periplasmic adaptor subunit n=1 Tax=Chachezhania antarctica TaxID=2340860 RepID=UPI000EB4E198|nr:efflux RND transporter periplasmic adaptor subunit [Chachezhania antarctica]|tara:strand:- start:3136 stop:4518 length:1383 start_codon:yes stop_codon:yes gene_type:complete
MRLIPILTAILVMVALYLAVFQRDALMAFARNDLASVISPDDSANATEAGAADDTRTAAVTPDAGAATATDATTAATTDTTTSPAAEPAKGTIGVVALRSKAQSVDSAVILRGETRAMREVEVRAETTARIVSEPLRKGTFVKKDDILCKLDEATRLQDVEQARAALAQAKSAEPEAAAMLAQAEASLEQANIDLTAAEQLNKGGYTSTSTLAARRAGQRTAQASIAAAESALEGAKAGIEGAEASLAKAERELDLLEIRAPFDGLLETDTAELGSLLQAGGLCATVIQLDPMKLVGFVPETQIARIDMGAQAGARLATGETVTGQVTFIGRSADPTTRTFLTEITVPNPDLKIRDGQTAEIAISAAGKQAHKLPQSALTLNNDGTLGVRTVESDGIVGFHPVELIRDDVDGIWVDGLADEANVIVVGQDYVTAGIPVSVTYKDDIHGDGDDASTAETKP